jgi:hypothetical protein
VVSASISNVGRMIDGVSDTSEPPWLDCVDGIALVTSESYASAA